MRAAAQGLGGSANGGRRDQRGVFGLLAPALDGLVCGDDLGGLSGFVGFVERVVGESLQFGEFLVEEVEGVGRVAIGVAGLRPGPHLGAAHVVESLGAATAPALGAQGVQHVTAVVVQLGERGDAVAFVPDGLEVAGQRRGAHRWARFSCAARWESACW